MPIARLRPQRVNRFGAINWASEQAQGLISLIAPAPSGVMVDWVKNASYSAPGTVRFHEGRIVNAGNVTRTGDTFSQTLLKRSYVVWFRNLNATTSSKLYYEGPQVATYFAPLQSNFSNINFGYHAGKGGALFTNLASTGTASLPYQLNCCVITMDLAGLALGSAFVGEGYVNGRSANSSSGTLAAAVASSERAGAVHTIYGDSGNSEAAEIRTYNRILSPGEVWRIYDPLTRDDLWYGQGTRAKAGATQSPLLRFLAESLFVGSSS